jgi:protein-disulfide isomerase/uncharacterized membrane protein
MNAIKKQSKETMPLPFSVYFWTVIFLALAGLADSVYLAISHYRVYTDISYSSFCAISKAINCDTVSQSIHSIFLSVPVPIWGVIGYTFFLLFLPVAGSQTADKKRIWPLLLLVSFAFSIYSIILASISIFYIHSYCIMCIVSFGINFLLLYYVWIIRKRFNTAGILEGLKRDLKFLWNKRVLSTIVFGPFFIGVVLVLAFFPSYWHFDPPKLQAAARTGITNEGHPWIGAEQPELVITEFTDYQCFQCKKMHFFLRQLIARYPDKIRLIHRHFPMDDAINPIVGERFHVGSGKMALFAEYTKTEDKFWQMNDILFKMAGHVDYINIKELAEKTELDYKKLAHATISSVTRYKVKHDIAVGIKLGITGTPGYLIDGKVYLGQIPPEIISRVLD